MHFSLVWPSTLKWREYERGEVCFYHFLNWSCLADLNSTVGVNAAGLYFLKFLL